MVSLFVIQGRDQGKRFELTAEQIGIGREASNTIQLHDTEVSRRHASLSRGPQNQEYTLVDQSSSNGTFVNNQRIDQTVLRSGDRVQVGRTLMIFTGADASSDGLTDVVDIVNYKNAGDGSRIIRSMTPEESNRSLENFESSESPWLARARGNLQIMYRTALAVSHTLEIDQLLSRIMELIFEWVEADRGCVMLVDKQTGDLLPKVLHHRPGIHTGDKITISRTILDYVMQNQEGVLTSDAQEDQRWDAGGSIVTMGVREAIGVPMQGRYGIVGVIYIDTYTPPGRFIQQGMANRFSDEHLKLMIAIGHQAALAVEDTSYYSALVQAERLAAIGQTIAGLSHHIKNILQGIRGGSYLIEEGLKNTDMEVVRNGWSIVEKNQERISNLVLDMLTFSKEREPQIAPADLNKVVEDVIELMRNRASECGVQLQCNPSDNVPTANFDADAIHRAILNVVTNAIDACQNVEQAKITVSTEFCSDEMKLRVLVRDNGRGIAEEDLKKIFTVFQSGKGARGTGLGLSVSQKILREHGGDIHAESQTGKGSLFTLEFPSLPPANSVSEVDEEAESPTKS